MFVGYESKGPDKEFIKVKVSKISFFKDEIKLGCDNGPYIQLKPRNFLLGGFGTLEKISIGTREYYAESDFQELKEVLENL
ncbi:MAG: hypothetical protein ACLSVP_00725 [Fusobacterium sp.]